MTHLRSGRSFRPNPLRENLRNEESSILNTINLDPTEIPIRDIDEEEIRLPLTDDDEDQLLRGQKAFVQKEVIDVDEEEIRLPLTDDDDSDTIPQTALERKKNNLSVVNFNDNPLTAFDNYTYKFTWFVTKPSVFNTIDPRTDIDRIIIAESGKSARFHIKNVEITSDIAPDFRTRNYQFSRIKFDIVEPKGFSLMDNIFNACLQLGIPNYFSAPYYLSCDFIVYDDEGTPKNLETYSKIWAMKIYQTGTRTDSEGTVYEFEAIEYEQLATSNQAAITRSAMKIFAADVGQFFDQFEAVMNKDVRKLSPGIYREIPDEYVFNVAEEIRTYAVTPGDDQKEPQKTADDRVYLTNDRVFVIPKGFDVGAIVDNVMTSSEPWVVENIIREPKDVKQNADENKFTKIWTVNVQTEIIDFDYIVNDYARRYIYNIQPYTSIRGNPDPEILRDDLVNKQKQSQRFNNIGRIFKLNKKYNYIYTGLNTEVLNFDMNLNWLWTIPIPLYKGLNRTNFSDVGSEVDTSKETLQKLEQDYIQKNNIFQRKVQKFGVGSFENTPDEVVAEQRQLNTRLDELRQERNLPTLNEAKRQRELATRTNIRRSPFVEDIKSSNLTGLVAGKSPNVTTETEQPEVQRGTTELPVTFVISGDDPETDTSLLVEGTRKEYRSVAASILNQVYFSSPDLFEIQMTVRGDPYWFGVSHVENRLNLIPPTYVPNTFADINTKDSLFLIQFRFPRMEEDNAGLVNSQQSDVISGIYLTRQVVHSFDNGQFTQTLQAVRDPASNIRLVGGI